MTQPVDETLQHHYQEQDKILESLDQVIERQHANALEISRELMTHQKLLTEVELDVDQTNGRLQKGNKTMKKLVKSESNSGCCTLL